MKILIAVPCADQLDVNFVDSLFHLKQPDGVEVGIQFAAGSLIYDARNGLAKRAVDQGFDYMLWFDSDMTFPPDILERLLEDIEGREFVSGLYFSRRPPFKPTIYQKCDVAQSDDGSVHLEWEHYKPIPSGIVEIAACGFGCVLMKTELLKDVFEKSGLPFSPILGFGEDLSVCVRLRQLGHKLHCDTRLLLGHTSHIVIGGDDYRTSWNNTL